MPTSLPASGDASARLGTKDVEITTHNRIGKSRARSIRQAIDWFHHGPVAAGVVQAGSPFPWDEVSDPCSLKQVAELDASGAMHRRTQARTRGKRVRIVVDFLNTIFQGYRAEISVDFFVRCPQ